MDALAASTFTLLDWGVVAFYFAVTTFIGWAMAGKQATFRDFFLGGRTIPWYAVSGSIIATEISAVTFVAVPALMLRSDGDFRYLQLGLIGALLARLIVAFVLVPAYYKREIYSPYDYMGNKLGSRVRRMTSVLFMVGGVLGQSARVYLTAVVLTICIHAQLEPLVQATGISTIYWSIIIISLISIFWTILGGIATVIWTDLLLFMVFMVGAFIALFVITNAIGGVDVLIATGESAGKFELWDTSWSPSQVFTVWTALFASTIFMTGMYGTDQLMAQRIFCCRSPNQAKAAIIFSQFGMVVTATLLFVGVGLYAYYEKFPMTGADAAMVAEQRDSVFPLFIVREMAPGLSGMLIAAIFAAAISSLTSILAALSQTTVSLLYGSAEITRIADADESALQQKLVRRSRWLVCGWGLVMMFAAFVVHWFMQSQAEDENKTLLDLALALAQYTTGALLAGFLLAFLPLKISGRGFLFSAPLSIFTVVGVAWQNAWTMYIAFFVGIVLLAVWVATTSNRQGWLLRAIGLLVGVAIMILVNRINTPIAWPWFAPIGTFMGLAWGIILGLRLPGDPEESADAPPVAATA